MIINYYIAQLGIVNQKRPEVWQSHLVPYLHQEDTGKVTLAIGNQKLRGVLYVGNAVDSVSMALSIGESHKLVDPAKVIKLQDDARVTLSFDGDHKLTNVLKEFNEVTNVGVVSLNVSDHKLYSWGIRAKILDEDNVKVSLNVSDHKLYEEKL